jgi:hypothetical protein
LYFSYFYLEGLGSFYFKENSLDWLDLFYENKTNNSELKKIWSFDRIEASKIKMDRVYGSKFFYLHLWEDKYLYDLDGLNYKKIDLNLEVLYIKNGLWKVFLIKTHKWTFVYDYQSEKIDYFSMFDDVVFYKNWYLAVIKKDDKIRINNFSLDDKNSKDKIIFWNTQNKQKKLLLETEIDIDKLIYIDDKVIFLDKTWEEFSLNVIDI